MKTLSLRLNENIFMETEKVLSKMHKPRNKYINEALDYYNRIQKDLLLAKRLERESKLVKKDSMAVLFEFESLQDENKAI